MHFDHEPGIAIIKETILSAGRMFLFEKESKHTPC